VTYSIMPLLSTQLTGLGRFVAGASWALVVQKSRTNNSGAGTFLPVPAHQFVHLAPKGTLE
jgi:hypothetical protein